MDPNLSSLDDLLASGDVDTFDGLIFCTSCAAPLAPVASIGLAVDVATEHLSAPCDAATSPAP